MNCASYQSLVKGPDTLLCLFGCVAIGRGSLEAGQVVMLQPVFIGKEREKPIVCEVEQRVRNTLKSLL